MNLGSNNSHFSGVIAKAAVVRIERAISFQRLRALRPETAVKAEW